MWTYIISVVVPPLVIAAVKLAMDWAKNLKWVKNLGIEAWIDKTGEWVCHWVENLSKSEKLAGEEKMKLARAEFEAKLKAAGIKLDSEEIDKRLAAIFNKYKPVIENK